MMGPESRGSGVRWRAAVRGMNAHSLRFALLGFAISVSGCSGANDLPESPFAIGGAFGPCDVGATRPCGLELGSDGSSITCARGNQLCQNGSWGACMPDAALGTTKVRVPS